MWGKLIVLKIDDYLDLSQLTVQRVINGLLFSSVRSPAVLNQTRGLLIYQGLDGLLPYRYHTPLGLMYYGAIRDSG